MQAGLTRARPSLAGRAALSALAMIALLGAQAWAQPPATRGLTVKAAELRRSRIVDVVGTAPLAGHNPASLSDAERGQLRDSAVVAGKAAALQQVSREIAEQSTAQLKLSLRGSVEDSVFLIDVIDLAANEVDFRVHLRAEVRYQIDQEEVAPPQPAPAPPPAASTAPSPGEAAAADKPTETTVAPAAQAAAAPAVPAAIDNPQAPLTVEFKVVEGRSVFSDGEQMVVSFRANKDCYTKIIYIDVEGHQIQVLPNNFRTDSQFKAGNTYLIPGEGDKFRLEVTAPFGTESFRVYASTAPLGESGPTQSLGQGLVAVTAPAAEVGRKTRSLKIVTAPVETPSTPPAGNQSAGVAPSPAPSAEFLETRFDVTTRARP